MGVFSEYSLPIQGLKLGEHRYKYVLDASFFQHFEDSPIGESIVTVAMLLEMRSDMMVLDFDLEGWISTSCDRCNADIKLPLGNAQTLYVKYSEEAEEDDDEVIFIHRDSASFNVAKYLYEFSVLSLPITNRYDCQNDEVPPCNQDVLQFLEHTNENDDDDAPPDASIWDALKDLK